jgi:hypothetical protein
MAGQGRKLENVKEAGPAIWGGRGFCTDSLADGQQMAATTGAFGDLELALGVDQWYSQVCEKQERGLLREAQLQRGEGP